MNFTFCSDGDSMFDMVWVINISASLNIYPRLLEVENGAQVYDQTDMSRVNTFT